MEQRATPICYVDPQQRGIVRFMGTDAFDGILAGTRAPLIVRAVNAHDALVGAMEELLRVQGEPEETLSIGEIRRARDAAFAALKLAKGSP